MARSLGSPGFVGFGLLASMASAVSLSETALADANAKPARDPEAVLEGPDASPRTGDVEDLASTTPHRDLPSEKESQQLEALGDLEALDDLEGLDDLDALATPGEGTADSGPRLDSFRASVAEEFHSYPFDRQLGSNDEALISEVELELSIGLTSNSSLFVRPWLMLDALDRDLARYEPLEAYLEVESARWRLTFGQFVESWAIADAFSPLDILNRRDLATDLLDPKVRGELGYRVSYHPDGGVWFGQPSLAVVVLPVWRRTELPTKQSRFSLESSEVSLSRDTSLEPHGRDAVFAAARVSHTLDTSWVSADLQYIAARGPERLPSFDVVMTNEGAALVPRYYGVWALGGGFRAVLNSAWWSKLTFKAELVYKRPYALEDVAIDTPGDYLQAVVGFDRLLTPILLGSDQLTLTVEAAGETGADDPSRRFRPFDSDLAVRLFWEAADFARSSFELRGVVDVKSGELIAEASVQRQLRFIHDDLTLELGGRWLRVPDRSESLLAMFPDNSRFQSRLEFNF